MFEYSSRVTLPNPAAVQGAGQRVIELLKQSTRLPKATHHLVNLIAGQRPCAQVFFSAQLATAARR